MIEVRNLTKRYGSKEAVNNISFTVNKGEILGFLGPNGAGKSTTMNIITGYISSTEGSVTINGAEIFENPIAVKKQIGYLPEQPPLYLDMTVDEYMRFMFDLKKVKLPRGQHLDEIYILVGIDNVKNRIIKNLSKGYRQRVGLAQALLGNPSVLILDEPTVGLDPHQIIEIRNLIKKLGENHTIILSSHILPEVQATCERVIVINQGQIIADDTPDNLAKSMSTDHKLIVRIEGPEDEVFKLLRGLPNIVSVNKLGKREDTCYEYSLEAEQGYDLRKDIFQRLSDRNWPIMGLKNTELSLEDIFLQLTSGKGVAISENLIANRDNQGEDISEVENEPNEAQSDEAKEELGSVAEKIDEDIPDSEVIAEISDKAAEKAEEITEKKVEAQENSEKPAEKKGKKKGGKK